MVSLPSRSTLFPYTTLFRSAREPALARGGRCRRSRGARARGPRSRLPRPGLRDRAERRRRPPPAFSRSEEHTSELQSPCKLVCRLLLEKKKKTNIKLILNFT